MIRSFLFKFLFYSSILICGIFFIPFLISRNATRTAVLIWAKLIIFLLKKIIGININFENNYIKKDRGYLIAANHQSIFETIFFLKEFDKVVYVVKKELKYIPIYSWYAIRLGNIFLDRKKRISSIKNLSKKVADFIEKKYKVIIFPEGTRQETQDIGTLKPGIFLLQENIDNKVYPIYINSGSTWPKSGIIKKNNIDVKTLFPLKKKLKKKIFLERLRMSFLEENKKRK